jgi:hypothetical protein
MATGYAANPATPGATIQVVNGRVMDKKNKSKGGGKSTALAKKNAAPQIKYKYRPNPERFKDLLIVSGIAAASAVGANVAERTLVRPFLGGLGRNRAVSGLVKIGLGAAAFGASTAFKLRTNTKVGLTLGPISAGFADLATEAINTAQRLMRRSRGGDDVTMAELEEALGEEIIITPDGEMLLGDGTPVDSELLDGLGFTVWQMNDPDPEYAE